MIPDFNNDEIEIEINPDDITVDTFRASGAVVSILTKLNRQYELPTTPQV